MAIRAIVAFAVHLCGADKNKTTHASLDRGCGQTQGAIAIDAEITTAVAGSVGLVRETGKMNYRLRTAQTLDPRWRRCRLARIAGIEIEPTFAPAPAGGVMAQRQQILQQRLADKAIGASNYAAHGCEEKREMTRSGLDFDRCADIDGLPDLFHVAIAQGNAAIGPIEFLGAQHCFFAPA